MTAAGGWALTWRRSGSVGGDHDGRGGDGAVADVHLDLVTRAGIQAAHVEVGARGSDVGKERSVFQVDLRGGGERGRCLKGALQVTSALRADKIRGDMFPA